ncbi:hypothetical protein D3C75_1076070 [compost metagenome]
MWISASELSSSAPTLNTPTTVKRLRRGNTPPGVTEASGRMKVSLSPTLTRKRRAVISPMIMPNSPLCRSSSRPWTMC